MTTPTPRSPMVVAGAIRENLEMLQRFVERKNDDYLAHRLKYVLALCEEQEQALAVQQLEHSLALVKGGR